MGSLKIATWNVNGIRAREAQLIAWLEEQRPDVVCLQEIKASTEQIPKALCALGEYYCHWHGGGGYSGVALLMRREHLSEPPLFSHPHFDYENRIVAAHYGDVLVASIYVPNGGKDFRGKIRFLEAMEEYAAMAARNHQLLAMCGDMNVARTDMDVHPKERKPNVIGQLPQERDLIERILSHDLVDVGRAVDPDNDGLFTWWAPWRNLRQRNIGWRLDYVMASRELYARVIECRAYREVGTSDHGPVIATFDYTPRFGVAHTQESQAHG
jgi:exodeoxyribonuclease-3